jgi:PilZ domain-containing protein
MAVEKRRSERLMLTVPLIVTGMDALGRNFKEDARSLILNRHGALIEISRPLLIGQRIRIVNTLCHREAEFSVVGPVAPRTEKGGQWGVECLNGEDNIWGIQFPPPSGNPSEPSALLECRKCHTAELKRVSLIEVEFLETSGILNKTCEHCAAKTPWGYAEKQLAMAAPAGEAQMLAEAAITQPSDQRRHRRVSLQLPILVRDYYGGVEISKSENVSKGGFCFSSEKNYHVGAGIMVACPYNSAEQSIEVPARIVRRIEVTDTHGKIYGARYEQVR